MKLMDILEGGFSKRECWLKIVPLLGSSIGPVFRVGMRLCELSNPSIRIVEEADLNWQCTGIAWHFSAD